MKKLYNLDSVIATQLTMFQPSYLADKYSCEPYFRCPKKIKG